MIDWLTGLVHPEAQVETFNIHEAKAQFSKILRQIERGEEVLIARGGVVIARIVPERARQRFGIGRDAGKGKIHDDFDAPLEGFESYGSPDRLLIAQSRIEGIPLITHDQVLPRYDVSVVDPVR